MIIREYKNDSDLQGLRNCVIAIQDFEKELDPRMPAGQDIVDEYVPDLFKRCESSKGKILVADAEGSIAGYVLILCKVKSEDIDDGDLEYGLISDVVVLADYRKKGYGRRLISAAEAEAKANNVKWLRIGVLSANSAAEGLYLSEGFQPYSTELEKELF